MVIINTTIITCIYVKHTTYIMCVFVSKQEVKEKKKTEAREDGYEWENSEGGREKVAAFLPFIFAT